MAWPREHIPFEASDLPTEFDTVQELVNMAKIKEQESGSSADREGVEFFSVILRWLWEKNRDEHEFFIEESFPIRWTLPTTPIPHGLIYKLNKTKLEALPKDVVEKDFRLLEALLNAPARRPIISRGTSMPSVHSRNCAKPPQTSTGIAECLRRPSAPDREALAPMAWQCGSDRCPHVLSLGSRRI